MVQIDKVVNVTLTKAIPFPEERTRLCNCGHTMIETEVLYSDLYECSVAFWECAHCHGIYEEFLE